MAPGLDVLAKTRPRWPWHMGFTNWIDSLELEVGGDIFLCHAEPDDAEDGPCEGNAQADHCARDLHGSLKLCLLLLLLFDLPGGIG